MKEEGKNVIAYAGDGVYTHNDDNADDEGVDPAVLAETIKSLVRSLHSSKFPSDPATSLKSNTSVKIGTPYILVK